MPGVTAVLLGNIEVRREFGKIGTQSDLHLHHVEENGVEITTLVAPRYPDQIKAVSYATTSADVAVLVLKELNAQAGEQILALASGGPAKGIILLQNFLQPAQIKPLLQNTRLADWTILVEDNWKQIREFMATCAPAPIAGPVVVPVDHHFDVKGVGAVILGVVRQGSLKKGETLYAYPGKVICPVRSIQVHDVDVAEAPVGDRVGVALRNTKADMLDRGMVLSTPDAPLKVHLKGETVEFTLTRVPFSKQPLGAGAVVQVGCGMQYVPFRLTGDAPKAGQEGKIAGTLEGDLVISPGDRLMLWHQDNAPQRVVGNLKA